MVNLKGNEVFYVQGVTANGSLSSVSEAVTTGQVVALAAVDGSFAFTAVTTVGNGTLPAAGLIGGGILRSGPTSAFSDSTPTAAQLVAAGAVVGGTFRTIIKNSTTFTETITAGTGVTLPPTVIVPALSATEYAVTINSATTATFVHVRTDAISLGANTTNPNTTSLSTVGAGTILALGFSTGFVARSGAQSSTAFTDTTDTAANIIAACTNLVGKIGATALFYYINTTNAPATISGGTGVTVSGITVVPAGSTALFIITETNAATLTMVGELAAYNTLSNNGTFTANGATSVTVANTAVTAFSNIIITLKTPGGTVSPNAPNIKTITPGTGFTVGATASDTSVYNYIILG